MFLLQLIRQSLAWIARAGLHYVTVASGSKLMAKLHVSISTLQNVSSSNLALLQAMNSLHIFVGILVFCSGHLRIFWCMLCALLMLAETSEVVSIFPNEIIPLLGISPWLAYPSSWSTRQCCRTQDLVMYLNKDCEQLYLDFFPLYHNMVRFETFLSC